MPLNYNPCRLQSLQREGYIQQVRLITIVPRKANKSSGKPNNFNLHEEQLYRKP